VTQVVTTILVDANNLFREGLRRILSTTVFRVAKVVAAVEDIPLRSLQGSRAVLFLVGADDDHAAAAVAVGRLKAKNPTARVVVLSDHCEPDEALMLLRAGADGYLLKQISCDALIKALDLVMLGVTILAAVNRIAGANDAVRDEVSEPAPRANVMTLAPAPRRLSDREKGILHCLMRGDSNKTIARQLDITEETVKVHIKAILRKISVRNRTQAAIWDHNRLLDPAISADAPTAKGNGHADSH
jgi:two-component system nitrate/nitrite response regulator NarL